MQSWTRKVNRMVQCMICKCLCAAPQAKELEINVRRVQAAFAWMKRPRETAGTSAADLTMEHLCAYGRKYGRGGSEDKAAQGAAALEREPIRARAGLQAAETSR